MSCIRRNQKEKKNDCFESNPKKDNQKWSGKGLLKPGNSKTSLVKSQSIIYFGLLHFYSFKKLVLKRLPNNK